MQLGTWADSGTRETVRRAFGANGKSAREDTLKVIF